ncbi:MAG: thioesterase family protein [Pseudohongiellaceae bacterium]
MSDSNFQEILTELSDNKLNQVNFGESWSQGRAAFGGLAAAFATRSMTKLLERPEPIRSLMVSFIGPLPPGQATVEAALLRQGKNVTQMSANVFGGDKLCLQAMGVFGQARESLSVPTRNCFKPVDRASGISFAQNSKRMPAFLQYFDGCWVSEGLPFSGNPAVELNMWVKHQTCVDQYPIEKIVAIADMPPPLILSHFTEPPVPASSLTWSLEFLIPPEEVKTDWFYLEFTIEAAADGYTQQSGKIWTEDGKLCALSRQCMVYFG